MTSRGFPRRAATATSVLLLAASAALSLFVAPPATADTTPPATGSGVDRGLSVSFDGQHYSREVADSLFSSIGRVVPGSTATDSVWLRNDADLTISVQLQLGDAWTTSHVLAEAATLRVGSPSDALDTDLGSALTPGKCTVVSPRYTLAPGESARVDARVTLSSALKDREGALQSMGFAVKAAAVDASLVGSMPQGCWSPSPYTPSPSPSPTPPPVPPTEPPLSNTGAQALAPALVGASLVALGLLAVARRRRRTA